MACINRPMGSSSSKRCDSVPSRGGGVCIIATIVVLVTYVEVDVALGRAFGLGGAGSVHLHEELEC